MKHALESFDYTFPRERIAQTPAHPRDAARLLVYDRARKTITHTTFRDLADHLPPHALLVFNDTKVIPARFEAKKQTGGRVRFLYLRTDRNVIYALADRTLTPGEVLALTPRQTLTVLTRTESEYALRFSEPAKQFNTLLDRIGTVPLPPYMAHSPLSERARAHEYQSMFALARGSVAAPTASLHFTPRLLRALTKHGHTSTTITLHVGLGTFASLTERQLSMGVLHQEQFEISRHAARTLTEARAHRKPIVAVGTTVTRTLESAVRRTGFSPMRGTTDLFIRAGYRFRAVDALITNFHVPRSSLLMLVSAFAGHAAMKRMYREALKERYRLFSFGDGMLIR